MKSGIDILSMINKEPDPGCCLLCGDSLPWNDRMQYYGQWAHFLPDTKKHRAYYGDAIIDSEFNGAKVCCLNCNNAVQVNRKSQPILADQIAARIWQKIVEQQYA